MSQMQRKWEQIEARRIKNKRRDGEFRGTSFVSGEELNKQDTQRRSLETLDKQGENNLKLQELKNKGGMEQVGYRQDAATGRFGERLGFDKSKFQQKIGETSRISDRDFKQATEQANRERYNKLLSGETDEFGDFLPGKEPMNPRDISEFMKNQDRFLSEQSEMSKTKGMPAAGQGRPVQGTYETVGKDGFRKFSNISPGEEDYQYAGRTGQDIRPAATPTVTSNNNALATYNAWRGSNEPIQAINKKITPGMSGFGAGISAAGADKIFPGGEKFPTSKEAIKKFKKKVFNFRTRLYNQ